MYLQLILSFLKIGALSFGGGLSVITLIIEEVVYKRGWLTMDEFANIVTVSESTPGPIAINCATFVGIKLAGFGGGIVATLACLFIPFIITTTLFIVYKKFGTMKLITGAIDGVVPVITGLVASAAFTLTTAALGWSGGISGAPDMLAAALIAAGVFCLYKYKPNPIFVIFASGIVGGAAYCFLGV